MALPSLKEYIWKHILALHAHDPYTNEVIVWSIQEYLGMKGEFHTDDLKTIYDYGFAGGDFLEEDEEEVVKCTACGYTSDVEGDVKQNYGRCPICGEPAIVVYGKKKKEETA